MSFSSQPASRQAAFAREIGWTKARLNEFIKGKRGVTADAALDLGERACSGRPRRCG